MGRAFTPSRTCRAVFASGTEDVDEVYMATRKFSLDSALGVGASGALELSGTTSADVVAAVAGKQPMPMRANGVLELGSIGLTTGSATDLRFSAGATKVGVSFQAGVTAGIGIYDEAKKALAALELGETPGLRIAIGDSDTTRFALLRAGYTVSGGVKGTHPIGAVGAFSFGASASSKGVTAMLHAFDADTPADAVLRNVADGWKLPRHVNSAASLPPRSWVLAEADGSIAATLGARVGYDFSFVREVKAAGLAGDVGLKIDAAAKATFGFDVSGRYLVVVGRESNAERVRVQLFKLSRRGVDFGLNLKVGVQGIDSLTPGKVDDFVKAVFGVHGAQVTTAMARLEAWTDPTKSVGELIAGLTNEKALELIEAATGIDPEEAFEDARAKVVNAIRLWQQLPERASSEVLGFVGKLGAGELAAMQESLALLSATDESKQRQALLALFSTKDFDATPVGQLLLASADSGLLSLLDRLPELRTTAQLVSSILDGDVLRRLQNALAKSLDLNTIIEATTKNDFDKLDSFLVGRLAQFLDRNIGLPELTEIRATIDVVLHKRTEIYDKARKALTTRYGAEIAATWQRTTSDTALLDVEIDASGQAGTRLLTALLRDGDFDALLTSASKALTFNAALLTHEARRKSTLQVTLPKVGFKTTQANTVLASVTVQEEGGRLLLYQMDATDTVTDTRRRYRSSLSLGLTSAAVIGSGNDLRVHGRSRATWSYQLLHARAGMQRSELEMYSRPFLEQFLSDRFGNPERWGQWYTELDRTVDALLANGPDQFGDTLLALEATIPAEALFAWMHPQPDVQAAAKAMSKAIQGALKSIIPFYHLQDPDRLTQNPSIAALLVWAAMPPVTSARVDGHRLVLDEGRGVYWDHQDPSLRRVLNSRRLVSARLADVFTPIRLRLQELGRGRQAAFFRGDEVPDWIAAANSNSGEPFFMHLCQFESAVVVKAAEALSSMQAFESLKAKAPSQAIDRLADFGADITQTFNKLASHTVYADAPVRVVTQSVFLDASRALAATSDGVSVPITPSGMLTLTVLKPQPERTFGLDSFLAGESPAAIDVLLEQRLVSART